VHIEQKFRMGVQIAPPLRDLVMHGRDAVNDRHGWELLNGGGTKRGM
jgi:hypothetical protein